MSNQVCPHERRRRNMPPRGVKNPRRQRQYEHIKESAKKRGQSGRAEEIAARTVNKQRSEAGEAKRSKKKTSTKGGKSKGGRKK
jgi:hypothetical protein